MKRLMMTIALSCVFSVPALAGDIPSVDVQSPNSSLPPVASGYVGEIPSVGFAIQLGDDATLDLVHLIVGLMA